MVWCRFHKQTAWSKQRRCCREWTEIEFFWCVFCWISSQTVAGAFWSCHTLIPTRGRVPRRDQCSNIPTSSRCSVIDRPLCHLGHLCFDDCYGLIETFYIQMNAFSDKVCIWMHLGSSESVVQNDERENWALPTGKSTDIPLYVRFMYFWRFHYVHRWQRAEDDARNCPESSWSYSWRRWGVMALSGNCSWTLEWSLTAFEDAKRQRYRSVWHITTSGSSGLITESLENIWVATDLVIVNMI